MNAREARVRLRFRARCGLVQDDQSLGSAWVKAQLSRMQRTSLVRRARIIRWEFPNGDSAPSKAFSHCHVCWRADGKSGVQVPW